MKPLRRAIRGALSPPPDIRTDAFWAFVLLHFCTASFYLQKSPEWMPMWVYGIASLMVWLGGLALLRRTHPKKRKS